MTADYSPQEILDKAYDDPLKVLDMCGGKYVCPKENGRRVGPLVAYRARDSQGRRLVGDLYANWASVEQFPIVASALASRLLSDMSRILPRVTVFCGAPEGGKHLADKLALRRRARYVYPEKRGEDLVWGRHEVHRGDRVALVEDLSNNFSTTEKLIRLIVDSGGVPVLLAAYFNRSPHVREMYISPQGFELPVFALVNEPWPEYEQDDPAVAQDVKADNVVWDVKINWSRLLAAMNQ